MLSYVTIKILLIGENVMSKVRKNVYTHDIDLTNLRIKNSTKEEFRKAIEKIDYRGYEVENISDGRKIVITKPGGKFTYGRIQKEDFMVFIFEPKDKTLWLISHKNIYEDLEEKSRKDPEATVKIIDALEKVFNGEEPDDVINTMSLTCPCGEEAEVLLKAYKWIWGQEDVNYPTGKGRNMSFESIKELRENLLKNRS